MPSFRPTAFFQLACAATLTLLLAPPLARANDEILTERIIGSEYPGKYKHPASITELDNGDFYMAFYGGDGEYEENSNVKAVRRKKGESTWSEPVVIADTPFLGEGNPVVWQAPDGLVWLFYNQRYGPTWSEARVKAKISRDGAETWSDSMVIAYELGSMCRGLPILLNDGDYLLPLYAEKGSDKENMTPDTASYFLRHDPKARTWTPTNLIHSKHGNLQPEPVQLSDDHLIAYMRRGGGYEEDTREFIVRSESHDGGRTWSEGTDTAFPNPNSAVSLLKLKSGNLLLVYNDSYNERTPLTVALSTDGEKTWGYKRDIGTGPHDFAYPVAIQTKDDKIRVLYTRDERQTVMLATFDEAAILSHPVK